MKKLLFFAVALAVLTGCKTVYVPVVEHEVHHDSIYFTQVQRDSIWMHDSISIKEKGDTVRIEKWHTKYIEKQVHDTTYVSKHDSIPVPYEVVKEVPAKLSKTEKGLMWLGLLTFIGGVVWIVFRVKKFLPSR